MTGTGLRAAIGMQLSKDHTDEREAMFAQWLRARPLSAAVYRFAGDFSPRTLQALLVMIFAAVNSAKCLSLLPGQALALFRYPNEQARWNSLRPALVNHGFKPCTWRLSLGDRLFSLAFFCSQGLVHFSRTRKMLSLIHKLLQKYPLFIVLRAINAAFIYIYLNKRFSAAPPSCVFISTDGNPHGCAVLGLSAARKISVLFASHGVISSKPVRLVCKIGIFYGQNALREYQSVGSQFDENLLFGFRGDFKPVVGQTKERICIALTQAPDFKFISQFVASVQREFPWCKVVLRPHPQVSKLPPGFLTRHRTQLSAGGPLQSDLENTFLLFAGNSTVHMEALMAGCASLYIPGLDTRKSEVLPFIADGTVLVQRDVLGLHHRLDTVVRHYQSGEFVGKAGEYFNQTETFAQSLSRLDEVLAKWKV